MLSLARSVPASTHVRDLHHVKKLRPTIVKRVRFVLRQCFVLFRIFIKRLSARGYLQRCLSHAMWSAVRELLHEADCLQFAKLVADKTSQNVRV